MHRITFPFPPSTLSGHSDGNRWAKSATTKSWRNTARALTEGAGKPSLGDGDIILQVIFTPPDNRSDRLNYYNRLKPIFDGMADAWGVNDKRFVPVIDVASFQPAQKPGQVEVMVLG